MEDYKVPRLKLKKRKKEKVSVKGSAYTADVGLDTGTGKVKLAKKKKSKITRIKAKGDTKLNIMDARMFTEEAGKEMLEVERMKSEKYIQKIIKGLK